MSNCTCSRSHHPIICDPECQKESKFLDYCQVPGSWASRTSKTLLLTLKQIGGSEWINIWTADLILIVVIVWLCFFNTKPPANTLSCDVTMHAVHFWGQGRSYLSNQRVSYLWLKERGREMGIWTLALGWNMDMQGINRLFQSVFQTTMEYRTIWQPDTNLPLEYQTSPVLRWLLKSLTLG